MIGNVVTFSNHSGIQISSHVNKPDTYNVLIAENTISDSLFNGISLGGQSNAPISNATIMNNVIYNVGENGIDSDYLGGSLILGNNITDSQGTAGIVLGTESDYNSLFGNVITKNKDMGIWIDNTANNNFVSGNRISDNGYGDGWNVGIMVRGDDSIIMNNIIGNTVFGIARNQLSGIYNYHTADGSIIMNNMLSNHVNDEIIEEETIYILQNNDNQVIANETAQVLTETKMSYVVIPNWIRDIAGFWCNDEINDDTFVLAIQYLIDNDVIHIKATTHGSGDEQEVPKSVKNNACWFVQGLISENQFASGIEFLVEQGIILV